MTTKERIVADLKAAMKAGDNVVRDTLRMLDSAIKNIEIEKKKREEGLGEEEVLEVVMRAVKQRVDSISQYEQGGRSELADKERGELEILKRYLPEQLGEEQVRAVVREVISTLGEKASLGAVMGQAMTRLKGKADGNLVRKIAAEELAVK
ncbi:MAG TPA: GatB/YqeY domain-containing protein [Candidatus Moranbacteria bacterium]|nr:GatB/YqeY domain-containing protein [Candidatus Moranbacteria bacterium]